jgi:hypothetical protein
VIDDLEPGSEEFEQCIDFIVNAFFCCPLTDFLAAHDYPSLLASRLPPCRDIREVRVILSALASFFGRRPELLSLPILELAFDLFSQFSPARLGRFRDSEAILVLMLHIIAVGLGPASRDLFDHDFYASLVTYFGVIPEIDAHVAEIIALSGRHFLGDPEVCRTCADFFSTQFDMNIAPALADLFVSFATSAPDILHEDQLLAAYRRLRRFQHVAKPSFRALRRVESAELLACGYFDKPLAGMLVDCLQSPDLVGCMSAALRTIRHFTRVDPARSVRFFMRPGGLYYILPLVFGIIGRGAFKEKAGAAMLFADVVGMAESPLRGELPGRMVDMVSAIGDMLDIGQDEFWFMGLVALKTMIGWCGINEALMSLRDKLDEFGVRKQIVALIEADDEATASLAHEICEAFTEDAWD